MYPSRNTMKTFYLQQMHTRTLLLNPKYSSFKDWHEHNTHNLWRSVFISFFKSFVPRGNILRCSSMINDRCNTCFRPCNIRALIQRHLDTGYRFDCPNFEAQIIVLRYVLLKCADVYKF